MLIYNQLKLKPLKRELRRNSTGTEKIVWSFVRNRQILGLKFFRQYGVESYILDFYCPQIRLAIEVDGGQHDLDSDRTKDEQREQYLNALGIQVLRFWNNEVLENPKGVYEKTISKINELLPTSSLVKEEESPLSFSKRGLG